jgi:hypothetical protein
LKHGHIIGGGGLVEEVNHDDRDHPQNNRHRAEDQLIPGLKKFNHQGEKVLYFFHIDFKSLLVKNPITAPTTAMMIV